MATTLKKITVSFITGVLIMFALTVMMGSNTAYAKDNSKKQIKAMPDIGIGRVPVWDSGEIKSEYIKGSVYYDAETGTLTLTDATVTMAYFSDSAEEVFGIYATRDLNVVLKGDNRFIYDGIKKPIRGIYGNGASIKLSGGGSLSISSDQAQEYFYGILATEKIELENVSLSVNGYVEKKQGKDSLFWGLYNGDEIILNSSSLEIKNPSVTGDVRGFVTRSNIIIDRSVIDVAIGDCVSASCRGACMSKDENTSNESRIDIYNDSSVKLTGGDYCYGVNWPGSVTVDSTSMLMVKAGESAFCPNGINQPSYADDADRDHILVNTEASETGAFSWDKTTLIPGNYKYFVKQIPLPGTDVTLSKTSFTYNGKVQRPVIKTVGGKALVSGEDYTVKWSNSSSKNVGTYNLTVNGKGGYYGDANASYKINKAANPLSVKGKTAALKYSKVKKKTLTLKPTAVIKFINAGQGTKTYVKTGGSKKILINKKTGKVTVKKGLKKGKYKVKAKVKASGNANYKASAEKPVTFIIKVK